MVSKSSTQDQVYAELRKAIIHMELLPGAKISVYDMSDKLGVSRTPVREAFIRLMGESLINVLPQRKTSVSLISMKRVQEECFLRVGLETAVFQPFMEICTSAHIDAMKRLMNKHIELMRKGKIVECLEVDDHFHRLAFVVTSQMLSWNAIEQMNGHYRRMRYLIIKNILDDEEGLNRTIYHHNMLIEATENRDYLKARNILKEHCRIEPLQNKWPDYFAAE